MYLFSGVEFPLIGSLSNLTFSLNNSEAPTDIIKENQIKIEKDKIIIYVENASLSGYAPTGSMKPVLDSKSNGIRIIPKSEEEINVGDIVSFRKNNILVVHRVYEKGIDNDGVYFITKGDNNRFNDGIIRFEEIEYKTIGVLW